MRWREWLRRAPSLLGRVLAVVTAFVLVYVAYAHVASLLTMREYRLTSYDARLDSLTNLARFEVVDRGGLVHELRGGVVHVQGTAASHPAEVRLVGPAQRLDDLVDTRLRFRVREAGAYDVFVGLQRADEGADAPDARRIVAVARIGSPVRFALEGDLNAAGARAIAPHITPLPPLAAGADGGADAAADEAWHELTLTSATYLRAVSARYDGDPVASAVGQWWMGTRVRLVFGVIAREPGARVGVELAEAAYTQRDRPTTLPPFADHFNSRVLDPRLWFVALPDGIKAQSSYKLDPAHGLVVQGRSLGEPGFQPAISLLTPPTPLASFTLRARVDVRTLKSGAFTIGIIGSGYSPSRFFDLGIKADANGVVEALGVGHWSGDGQLGVQTYPGQWKGHEATITMTYEAKHGTVAGSFNGIKVCEYKLDLFAGDDIQLRVLASLQAADAVVDLALREVTFERPLFVPMP